MRDRNDRVSIKFPSRESLPRFGGGQGWVFTVGYKTIMGTIPRSSSHSPFTTEAANGVGLLLFWPAALQVLRSGFATHGFQVLLVTADPSGCPFLPVFRRDFPGRSVIQAPVHISRRIWLPVSVHSGPKPFVSLRPCDSVVERTFPVFFDLLNIRDWSGTRFPSFRLRLS